MFLLKNGHTADLSWANCHAKLSHSKQFHKSTHSMRLAHSRQLYATAATKKKDVTTKRLHTRSTFRQSLTASVDESQVVEKTQVWYLSITELRSLGAIIETRCGYNNLLPVMREISSKFFIFQQGSARRTWGLRQSTFLPIIAPDIDRFY